MCDQYSQNDYWSVNLILIQKWFKPLKIQTKSFELKHKVCWMIFEIILKNRHNLSIGIRSTNL